MAHLPFQPSLFDAPVTAFDATFRQVERLWLDEESWLDVAPGWVQGSDALFQTIVAEAPWKQRTRHLYDQRVLEPRLTAPWNLASGRPLTPPIIEDMRQALSARYGVTFDSVGFNLYRNGEDSVAWHGDTIDPAIEQPIVVLVSLGEPRKLHLRKKGGGPSRAFSQGRGDLLVTGGRTQRMWEHSIPKVRHAGPRISLAFRYGLQP